MPYREVEEDIRSGALATGLSRPMGYAQACLAQWCGAAAFRLPVFAVIGFGAALWFSGTVPLAPAMLLGWLLSAVLAVAILYLCQLMIGLATTWTDSAGLAWLLFERGLRRYTSGNRIIELR